jgi:hypothetical protein
MKFQYITIAPVSTPGHILPTYRIKVLCDVGQEGWCVRPGTYQSVKAVMGAFKQPLAAETADLIMEALRNGQKVEFSLENAVDRV